MEKKGNIIHFAVSKNHIGVYVREEAIAFFEERLKGVEIHKGVIRLKLGQEMPLSLIADISKRCQTAVNLSQIYRCFFIQKERKRYAGNTNHTTSEPQQIKKIISNITYSVEKLSEPTRYTKNMLYYSRMREGMFRNCSFCR